MVTLESKKEGCQGRTEAGARWREMGGTTRREMKEIDGGKAAEKREERKPEEGEAEGGSDGGT